jgi:hypothetical protein
MVVKAKAKFGKNNVIGNVEPEKVKFKRNDASVRSLKSSGDTSEKLVQSKYKRTSWITLQNQYYWHNFALVLRWEERGGDRPITSEQCNEHPERNIQNSGIADHFYAGRAK